MDKFLDGKKIVQDAWDAFDRWCAKHDPDGEMDQTDLIEAYGKWCEAEKRAADSVQRFSGEPNS